MASPRILEWKHLTGKSIEKLDRDRTIVAVTCSPLEVHGPHLPTIADMCEAEGLFDALMDRLLLRYDDLTFLRLPPTFVAADVLPHVGSLKFSPQLVANVMEELGTTLVRQGFRNIWVSNFHAGPRHVLAIEKACDRVNRRRGGRMISVFSLVARRLTGGGTSLAALLDGVGGLSRKELEGDAHGGVVETALLLHLIGKHVDADYTNLPPRTLELKLATAGKKPLQKGDKPTLFEIFRSLPLRAGYYEDETYSGSPSFATAELGQKYLDILADEAVIALSELLDGTIGPEDCFSPLFRFRHLMLNRTLGRVFDRVFARKRSPV
jgi:creatinine amidohydrolase